MATIRVSIVRGTLRAPFTPGTLLDGGTANGVVATCLRDRVTDRTAPFPDTSDTPLTTALASRTAGPVTVVHDT